MLDRPAAAALTVSREQVRNRLGLTDAQFAALQVSPTSLVSTSDIAAISQNVGPALQGTVTFSSSGVNPDRGLVELPQNVVIPEALIAANPCAQGAESAFTVTGKGGVPSSPNDALSSESAPFPWVEIEGRRQKAEGRREEIEGRRQKAEARRETEGRGKKEELGDRKVAEIRTAEVVPARGWVMNDRGEVILVAYDSTNQFHDRTRLPLSICQPR
jgi:hypothetical protein